MASITIEAPAKLNLTLDILGKRADGYHEMKMVMQSVSLADTLTLAAESGTGVELSTNLGFLPVDGKNLAVKAARELERTVGASLGHLTIQITKRIPVCAGTAGGSSDAAAVLHGLNELLKLGLTIEELAEIGKRVGSDVPYCVLGGTALAEGRGELLTALPALPPCWVVLAKPDFPVSTPQLFSAWEERKTRCHPDTTGMISAIHSGDLNGVARRLFNVFEEVLPPRRRDLVEELKRALVDYGALGASMTGTGPTVFGLFDQEDKARSAFQTLRGHCRDTFLAHSL